MQTARFVERGAPIVLGLRLDGSGAVALHRAFELAVMFEARLELVYSVPWREPPLVETVAAVEERVIDWAASAELIGVTRSQVFVTTDSIAQAVEERVSELGAALVVLDDGSAGATGELARRVRCPILVARPPRRRDVLLAATDLRDARYPVVGAAAALADACAAGITVVHNLEDPSDSGRVLDARIRRPLRALARLGKLDAVKRAHCFVQPSTPEIIAEVSEKHGADIVAIGARASGGRTCSSVITSLRSSVLVVPLPPV